MKKYLPLLLALGGPAGAGELKPFTSDGCSDFPDGTPAQKQLWLSCCRRHDLAYWQGGTYQQRLDADLALRACVAKVGEPAIGLVMLAGVRMGGTPLLPTRFRWGYGWPYPRLYGPLSEEERQEVKALAPDHATP
ncbi:hypothetical protein PVT67_17245 [Gallaecimonas kandeliae]|uniref:hypothetical protein n=1 Tax=Gallaecimonas kandeliae TaxID=3029055 RepID=UPI0026473431|nr:hypothetical protein [Gallaecimonas kandeliae]WKE65388.1 hypothetical protein PVT67_17245 [Gallaecimonas kandeliae]